MKEKLKYFTPAEYILWSVSTLLIVISFAIFDRSNYLTLAASLIGSTAILVSAKGNPISQVLMIVFSIIYTYISYTFAYYGEMITYLGMTMPMAFFSLISWLRNPYKGKKSEVEVNTISKKEACFMLILAGAVTFIFYFILDYFDTSNMIPSTFSVTTSFVAVYLTFRRSPYFSLAYAANDIVLILLWSLATIENISYLSVVVCFTAFLANDIYAYFSWRKMELRQRQ